MAAPAAGGETAGCVVPMVGEVVEVHVADRVAALKHTVEARPPAGLRAGTSPREADPSVLRIGGTPSADKERLAP